MIHEIKREQVSRKIFRKLLREKCAILKIYIIYYIFLQDIK